MPWYGSKACKKKYFISPQWLRSIKNRKYPMWRFDILLSNEIQNLIVYNSKEELISAYSHINNQEISNTQEIDKQIIAFTTSPPKKLKK